jgi:HEPN domain-containing protein
MDSKEYDRRISMARRTIESAKHDTEAGDYNWACFKAHQAGESAIKAALYGIGRATRGHSLTHLIAGLSEFINVPNEVVDLCKLLDKFYVTTRYVDTWSEGAPYEYFTRTDAETAIKAAEGIITFIENLWRRLLSGGRS